MESSGRHRQIPLLLSQKEYYVLSNRYRSSGEPPAARLGGTAANRSGRRPGIGISSRGRATDGHTPGLQIQQRAAGLQLPGEAQLGRGTFWEDFKGASESRIQWLVPMMDSLLYRVKFSCWRSQRSFLSLASSYVFPWVVCCVCRRSEFLVCSGADVILFASCSLPVSTGKGVRLRPREAEPGQGRVREHTCAGYPRIRRYVLRFRRLARPLSSLSSSLGSCQHLKFVFF